MKITPPEAHALKLAVKQLRETPHGIFFLEYLEECAGKFAPTYDPTSQTSIILAAGRTEMVKIIRNIERLDAEQIVIGLNKGA